MIICDNCKKEIKRRENKTVVRIRNDYKHYCRKCSPFFFPIWIVLLVAIMIFVIVISLVLWVPF